MLAAGHERAQAAAAARRRSRRGRRIDLVGRRRSVDRGGGAAALRAVHRQRYRADAHRRRLRHADLGPVRPEPQSLNTRRGGRAPRLSARPTPPETMFGPGFDHRTTDTLMDGLSVDAAEAAARRLWGRGRERRRREPAKPRSPPWSSPMTRNASSPIACAVSVLPTRSSSCSIAATTARGRSRRASPIAWSKAPGSARGRAGTPGSTPAAASGSSKSTPTSG